MLKTNLAFVREIKSSKKFDAQACINCGVCTAICPMEINMLPRELFHFALLGVEGKVLENQETIYSCLLCKLCEANCPAEVKIAENVKTLRYYINRKVFGLEGK